jgi:N-methylhydantoinase B
MFGDGKRNPPYGLFGGMPGSCNLAYINEGQPDQRELRAKEAVKLKKGDTYTSYPSGGGGWGSPLRRDPELVRNDVKDGIISIESARALYGVVLEGEDRRVNEKETRKLRTEIASSAPRVKRKAGDASV